MGGEIRHVRLDPSCCRPALTAAAACREVDADRGEGEGLCPRRGANSPEFDEIVLVIFDDVPETEMDLEGGREFKSGAILKFGVVLCAVMIG